MNNLTADSVTPGQKILISTTISQDKVKVLSDDIQNPNVERLIDIARSYLGVKKYSAEHKALVNAYNKVYPRPLNYALTYDDDWCDGFVSAIADKAGLAHLTGREVGVERHKNILKYKGIWKGLTIPKAGDLVIFNWNQNRYAWGSHIGIVEAVKDGMISTIEGNNAAGNSSSTVGRRSYKVNSGYIQGFARPRY